MKELVDLASEIVRKEGVVLEYIDRVEFQDGQVEEIYYMTDPENKRTDRTITLVLIGNQNSPSCFVASVGLSQIPLRKYHTQEQFHEIIMHQSEHPVDCSEIEYGAIDECLNMADVYFEWMKKISKTNEGVGWNE